MGYVIPATPELARELCPLLRDADRAEVVALTGAPPEIILPERASQAFAMFSEEGELAGLCGCDPVCHAPEVGVVWMVGSNLLVQHPVEFLRASRLWLDERHGHYPILTNRADARNAQHLKWLRWLGFRFLQIVEPWGAEGRPFIEFAKYKEP
ncbi:hypothetical protein [Castellaniella sp.]|uniref:hypothetical protein n=1 Tax=Castellaniella sp. TaxID=1955812 RepID=UPI002AFEDC90|nr:hypothetical protein [Castellaniella sp.]